MKCKKCGKEFERRGRNHQYCQTCSPIVRVSKAAQWRITVKYGITREEYDSLLISQSGRCAICGEAKPLGIDHDHETGKVRGLLCATCNFAVGFVLNKPELAIEVAKYLK